MSKTKVWTRDEIAQRILSGQHIVIFRNNVLSIPTSWLDAHPGGSVTILHFVGRDATDEIEAYHSEQTLSLVAKYSVGTVKLAEHGWDPLIPPVMSGWVRKLGKDGAAHWHHEATAVHSHENTEHSPSSQILLVKNEDVSTNSSGPTLDALVPPPSDLSLKTQYTHSKAYRELHKRITEAGLYKTPFITGYGPEFIRYTLLACISIYAYKNAWFMTSALFLGLFWHQVYFFCHDLGHMGVTHDWFWDRLISIALADFVGGLSIGWWVDSHNTHHLVTNHPSHDPDIQHLPFFAVSPVFFGSLWSSYYKRTVLFDKFAKFFVAIQHRLFYIVLGLARFNLYANSYGFLFKKAFDTKRVRGGRWAWALEVIGVIVFWYWFGNVLYGCGTWQKALGYLLISHVTTSPLHVQIVLSHFSMSTADLGPNESFVHRQLRTTTDVICPPSLGFIHGGLHLQVTHHLFPRLPRHNLREASMMVKEFTKEQGLSYAEFGFINGNKEVVGVLRSVAEQVSLIGMVGKAEAEEAVDRKLGIYKDEKADQ